MANVDIIINTIDKGSQGAVSFAKSFGNAWKDVATPLNQTLELLGKVQQLGADAFAFFEQGATINQVAESFDRLNDSVWKTPELLSEMKEAARGTISEFDAMRGLLTLTAGMSDEMSKQFANAAPQLLEIAKAANKLNPTLGDTAFLYESLATGIKRGSALIIDNLGITVTAGEAYELFAQKVGKAANELSAEEQKLAILQLTMGRGGKMIEQVGGDVDSAADAYQRLTTIVQETGNVIKSSFSEAVATNMDDITESVEELGPALAELAEKAVPAIVELTQQLPAFIDQTTELAEKAEEIGRLAEAYGKLALIATPVGAVGATGSFIDWLIGDEGQSQEAIALLDKLDQYNLDKLSEFAQNTPTEMKGAAEEISEVGEVANSTGDAIDGLADAFYGAKNNSGDLLLLATDFNAVLEAQEDAANANAKAIELMNEAYRAAVAASGDYFTQALENQADPEYEFSMDDELYRQADAAGASAEALAILKLATGEFTEEQAIAALKMVAINEAIERQAELLANLGENVSVADIEQARQNIQSVINTFSESDAKVTITPEVKEDPEFAAKMAEMFGADPTTEGGGINIPVGIATEQASTDVETFIADDIGPYFEEPYEVTVEAEIEGARDNINEIIDLLNDIDRVIEVMVNVNANIDEELDAFGI